MNAWPSGVLWVAATVLAAADPWGSGRDRREASVPDPGEERAVARGVMREAPVIELEKTALEQYGRGAIEGPLALCDEDISYFDASVERRVDGREALAGLYEKARGKPQYARFEMRDPHVQVLGETAILSYVLSTFAALDTTTQETRWKVTTIYHHFTDGWRVVHSHFALFAGTTPRDLRPAGLPANLDRLEDPLLRELLGLEDAAMERWRRGDPQGFLELSAPGVTYFDPETNGRLNDREALRALYAAVEGRIRYDISEYFGPRVQRFGDVAVLSFQYRSGAVRGDRSAGSGALWNTTEVFARIDGRWRTVHTHWSYARAGED